LTRKTMANAKFSLREAQLYRLLAALFSEDRVIPYMSLAAVLGEQQMDAETVVWCKQQSCLFTIVSTEGEPKFVLDFAAVEGETIDPLRVDLHRRGKEILQKYGIYFFALSEVDFESILLVGNGYTLVHYFNEQFAKLGIDLEIDQDSQNE